MSGDARDFNDIETRELIIFFSGKAPKEIPAILIETLGEHYTVYRTNKPNKPNGAESLLKS
jgi:hypothetical protein